MHLLVFIKRYPNEYSPILCSRIRLFVLIFVMLGSSSAGSVDVSSFGCVILTLYLTMNVAISSLIVGVFKSVCKILLGVYHGAFTLIRGALF
jgi:hypothetical protein